MKHRENWLWDNTAAIDSVMLGVRQAAAGEFVDPPDLEAGQALADSIEDDETAIAKDSPHDS